MFFQIKAIYIDDAFIDNGCIRGHDFAIIEVVKRIKFNKQIRPICLPKSEVDFPDPNKSLITVGWGRHNGN